MLKPLFLCLTFYIKKFYEIFTKYGAGTILGAVSLDGYRRQVSSDDTKKKLDEMNKVKDQLDHKDNELFDKEIAMKDDSRKIKLDNINQSKKEYEERMRKYQENKNDYNKNELEKSKANFDKSLENLAQNNIGEFIFKIIEKYYEFLSTLTADKIVALFNIIMGALTLSSFFTVMSIMLSEQIINKIKFLEKYPKILKLFKLRNNINKSLNKIYLTIHIIFIILTLLGNLFMFLFH